MTGFVLMAHNKECLSIFGGIISTQLLPWISFKRKSDCCDDKHSDNVTLGLLPQSVIGKRKQVLHFVQESPLGVSLL